MKHSLNKALKLPRYEQLHVCSTNVFTSGFPRLSTNNFAWVFQLLELDTDLLKHFSSLCILILGHVYSLQKLCEWKSQFLNMLTLSGSPWQWERWDINKTIERLKVAAAAAAAVRTKRVHNPPRQTQQERNFRTYQREKLLQSINARLTMSNNASMSSIQAAAQETLELGASVSFSTKKHSHIHTHISKHTIAHWLHWPTIIKTLQHSPPSIIQTSREHRETRITVSPKTFLLGHEEVWSFSTHLLHTSPSSWAPSATSSLMKVLWDARDWCCRYSKYISRVFPHTFSFLCRSGKTHLAAIFHHHWSHEPRGGDMRNFLSCGTPASPDDRSVPHK